MFPLIPVIIPLTLKVRSVQVETVKSLYHHRVDGRTTISNNVIICTFHCNNYVLHAKYLTILIYEGESISNQPIPFPMDRDGHDFHALFQCMFYTWVQNCTRIDHSLIRY